MADLPRTQHADNQSTFDFRRLSEYGVLWLINRVVFHPRGFALALFYEDGEDEPKGWQLVGPGVEPWVFDPESVDEDRLFNAVEGLFAQAREFGVAPHPDSDEVARIAAADPENTGTEAAPSASTVRVDGDG